MVHEDLRKQLRPTWQQTEDLSRKKEIRARMYKLREQRLKEFYTTGEVLQDVQRATPQKFQIEEIDTSEEKSLVPVINPQKTMTHTDSIKDRGFMTMKSQEIRDSESPTRNYQVFHQGNGGNDSQSYWKVQSSSESYQAVGRDGQYEVTSQSQNRNMAGENGRITVDTGFATENKSVMDRNGDVRVISSRAYDTSGRDISGFGGNGDVGMIQDHVRRGNVDGFDGGNVRYVQDVNGDELISRTTGSRSSETRMSSSSQMQRSSVQTHKTSSSTVTSSRSTTSDRFGDRGTGDDVFYIEKFDDTNGDVVKQFTSGSNVAKRGVTEVKKTIIRGGKVITETVTYIDGKPVDGTTKTTTTTTQKIKGTPTETVTVIRGGKLIKETVPVKPDDDRTSPDVNRQKKPTDPRNNTESFITTERYSSETQIRGRDREPFDTEPDSREGDVPNKQSPNAQKKAPTVTTKTVIRGGKVIKEVVPTDVGDTEEYTYSSTERSNHQTSKAISRSSVTESTHKTEVRRSDHHRQGFPDNDYPDRDDVPGSQGYDDPDHGPARDGQPRKGRPGRQQPQDGEPLDEPDDYEPDVGRRTTGKTTTTKTVTVIRGGKVMKQTVTETVDDNDITKGRKPGQLSGVPDDDDVRPRRPQSPSHKDSKKPRDHEPDVSRNSQVTVKTIKTVIRGGKLVKEAVPDDVREDYDDPDYDDQRPERTPQGTSPGARPEKKGQPQGKQTPQQPKKGQSPRDVRPVDDDDDLEPERITSVRDNQTETRKSTKHSTEVKTVTVIRGGKIIKEQVTVSDDEETLKGGRKPDTHGKTPQRKEPSRVPGDVKDAPGKKPKKSPGDKPRDRRPDRDIPSDREGSEYPSGSEAPDVDEEMPYKVVTVIRSGKLIKEMVPISDDEPEGVKPSKSFKDTPQRTSPEGDRRPSASQPGKSAPDQLKSPEKDHPVKGKKKPGSKSPQEHESEPEGEYPGQRNKPRQPGQVPGGRSSPMGDEPDDERPKSGKPRHGDEPDDDHPGRKSPRKSSSPSDEKHRPGRQSVEPLDSDTDERPTKTIKVIRSGKVYTETVEMTDDEIRERKLMKVTQTPKGRKSQPGDDVERPLEPNKKKPGDSGKSPTTRNRPEDTTDFIEHEKLQPVQTITVIRSGKIVKEVTPRKDREPSDEEPDEPGKPGKPGRKQPKEPKHGKPRDDEPNDRERAPHGTQPGRSAPGKSVEKPGYERSPHTEKRPEQEPEEPGRRSPSKTSPGDEEPYGRTPQDGYPNEPQSDKTVRRPGEPDRRTPDTSGRRPDDEQPDKYGRKPGDHQPGRTSPDKTRPVDDRQSPDKISRVPDDDEFVDKPQERQPHGYTSDKTHKRPGEPGRSTPERTQRRPGDDEPEDYNRRPGEPTRYSPGSRGDEPDRRTPDTFRRPADEPDTLRPDRVSPEKDGVQPKDSRQSPHKTSRRPGDDEPDNRKPQGSRPNSYSRRPDEEEPDEFSPDKSGTQPREPDTTSRNVTMKTVTVIRSGKIIKELVPVTDRPDEDGKKPGDRQPDRVHPLSGTPGIDRVDDYPEEYSPDKTGRRPGEPGRQTPDRTGRRPGTDGVDDYPEGYSPDKTGRRPGEPGRQTPDRTGRRPGTDGVDDYPEEYSPDKTGRRPGEPARQTPDRTGRRPGTDGVDDYPEGYSPDKTGRRPGEPGRQTPDRTGRRPGTDGVDDYPEGYSPDKTGRRPGEPGRQTPDRTGRRPGTDGVDDYPEEYRPDKTGRRPGEPGRQTPDRTGRHPGTDGVDDYPEGYSPDRTGRRQGTDGVDDYPEGYSPDKTGRRPGEPGRQTPDRTGRRPGTDGVDDYPEGYSPDKTGRRPGEPDRRTPDRTGRRPGTDGVDDYPEEYSPDKTGRRPGEPGRQTPDRTGRRPGTDGVDDYPEGYSPDKTGRRPGEPDRRTPDRTGRRPGTDGVDDYPEGYSPDKTGRRPGEPGRQTPDRTGRRPGTDRVDDYPEEYSPDKTGRRPREPGRQTPDRTGRRPGTDGVDDYPEGYSPDKTGRRPGEPGRQTPDRTGRRPGTDGVDDYPEEYSPDKTGRRPGEPGRQTPDRTGRRPGTDGVDDYPEGYSPDKTGRRPGEPGRQTPDRTGRRPGTDGVDDYPEGYSPDKTGRRPGEPDRRTPDRTGRHPGTDGVDDYPEEYSPDKTGRRPGEPDRFSPNRGIRRPEDDLPDQYGRRPRVDQSRRSPDKPGKGPEGTKPNQFGRKPQESPDHYSPRKSTRRPDGMSPDGVTPKAKTPGASRPRKPDHPDRDEIYHTTEKISVDVSASHAQFASSLRAPPLERPETPVQPYDDRASPKTHPARPTTPKGGRPTGRDSPLMREKILRSSPNDLLRQRRPDSPGRILQRPSSKINDVISRLTSDTTSSRERRKLTSRNSRSIISKRTRTPGVSPHTSPSRDRPKSDKPRRTSSGSTSSVSTEKDSDFHYQQPEEPEQPTGYSVDESFIRIEREESRRTQQLIRESDDYPADTSRRPRSKSPSDVSKEPHRQRPHKREPGDDGDYPYDQRPRRPEDVDDSPRDGRKASPTRPREDDTHPSRKPTSSPTQRPRSPTTGRSRSPSSKSKPRDYDERYPRSTSLSPRTSPDRKYRSPDSADGRRYPQSPKDDPYGRRHPLSPKDDTTRKPKSPEKLTPLKSGTPGHPKKDLTEFPSQRRVPTKPVEPVKGKPKTPTGTKPGDRPVSTVGTPGSKKPDLTRPKQTTTKPTMRPQNGVPAKPDTNKYPTTSPLTSKKPKSPTSVQAPKPKSKPTTPNGTIPGMKKPVGKTPSTGKVPTRGRKPCDSDDEDIRKLTDFATTTRHTTTTTTVETRNFINTEKRKVPGSRTDVIEWIEEPTPDDASSVSSQERRSPTGRRPSSPGSKPRSPKDKLYPGTDRRGTPTQPGTKQPDTPRTPGGKDRPKGVPSDHYPGSKKPVKSKPGTKHPDHPESESESEELPTDVEFITGEKKPRKPKDGKYTEEIDMIRREQETTYGTRVTRTSVVDTEEYTGHVELPDTSRESTRSPDVNRLKCVPVNENDTEELRPRYADQVSEPEDDTYGERKPSRKNKRPENVPKGEEPKKNFRDMLVKSALEKIDRIPDFNDTDVTNETVNISVAERVNKFMETALKPDSPQPSRPEDITLKGLDDTINEYGNDMPDFRQPKGTTSVIKAKTMFETIANQTVVTGTARRDQIRQDDILSRPSVFQPKSPVEKEPKKPGRRPSGRDSDESPDRSRSPKSRDKPRDRDEPTRSRPGSRGTSPRRMSPSERSKSPRRPGQSPDRYRTSPTRDVRRPDDDHYDRKPQRPQDGYGTTPRSPRDDRSPVTRHSRPRSTTSPDRSPDRYGSTPRRPGDSTTRYSERPEDNVKPGRRPSGSPDRYGSKPKSDRPGDFPDSHRGRPDTRETSPQRRSLYPYDKTTPSKPTSGVPNRYGIIPGEKPKNKAPTPDRYGSVPGSTTKKPTTTTPRRPGEPSDRPGYPKGKSPSPTKGRPSDRDTSPRRRGESPIRYTGRKQPGSRPDTYEPPYAHKTRPSAQRPTSPDRDYPGMRSKSQSPDRYGSYPKRTGQRPDDLETSPSRRSPTRPDYDTYRPTDRDYSPTRRYSPDWSPSDRDLSPSRRPYGSPTQSPTKKSPSKELADQVRRLSSPKKDFPLATTSKPDTTRFPHTKVVKPEPTRPGKDKPVGVVDKYSLMDYDKRTTTTTSTSSTKFTSHVTPHISRVSPDKQRPLFSTTRPKTSGHPMPEDTCLSPTFEKTHKIPENSSLKAPALLKKQKQPDDKRYTSSLYKPLYGDDDDRPGRQPSVSKPFTSSDSKFSKFGVTLKKTTTTTGGNFVRKGPVDVGKKETELDRTYDLDILNAMLERARGYEERRLIRGQIRNVKTMIENNELRPAHKKPLSDDYRPTSRSPSKTHPSDYNGYEPDSYTTYRTHTTTETTSIRTSSPDRYLPREGSPGKYPMRSTATLTLSSPSRRSPEKPSSMYPDRKSPEKTYPRFGGDPTRPGTKTYQPDREPVGTLIDSETRKHLRRSQSPQKVMPRKPFGVDDEDDYPGRKPYGFRTLLTERLVKNKTSWFPAGARTDDDGGISPLVVTHRRLEMGCPQRSPSTSACSFYLCEVGECFLEDRGLKVVPADSPNVGGITFVLLGIRPNYHSILSDEYNPTGQSIALQKQSSPPERGESTRAPEQNQVYFEYLNGTNVVMDFCFWIRLR
ncbi:hypothetical protein RUM43_005765 [Polyplax serrata]|uniref:Smoothelin domain-containing protein n=1 Tax=Polyplax serrata TaxID=468196 RepID=A0AAN8S506_POLSC